MTLVLSQEGYDVLGGYISPVNDAYAKPGLAPAQHRVRMAELAVASSPLIMVDSWEAAQPGYSRTLTVMQRVLHKSEESLTGSPPESNDGCGLPAAVQSAVNTGVQLVKKSGSTEYAEHCSRQIFRATMQYTIDVNPQLTDRQTLLAG